MSLSRRLVLKMAGAAAAGPMLSSRLFASEQALVPEDKGFAKGRLEALTRRGSPRVIRDPRALRNIGMPIGGICCGQVYLGGDGRLWHWDIFGAPKAYPNITAGTHYANPMSPESPWPFGFTIAEITAPSGTPEEIPLESPAFDNIEFEPSYPSARVRYRRKDFPFGIELEAMSPFIPLDEDSSGLPVIRMHYRITNHGPKQASGLIACRTRNPVGQFSGFAHQFTPRTRPSQIGAWEGVVFDAIPRSPARVSKPDVELADWKDGSYGGWIATGTAFGPGPVDQTKLPERIAMANPKRRFFVNTHEARHGEESVEADRHLGTLTSPEFRIERPYLTFMIGGGEHPNETCLNLLVEGKVVRTETGRNSSVLRGVSWDVKEFEGKIGTLQIVDRHIGGWGHVSVDSPKLSMEPLGPDVPLDRLPDFGSFGVWARVLDGSSSENQEAFPERGPEATFTLSPGKSVEVEFLVAWHFPNYGDAHAEMRAIRGFSELRRHYANRFPDAEAVAMEATAKEDRLFGTTKRWIETWYDSTLPRWFLERTLIPLDCLQTATAHRFDNGRFYGWEGIYCCAGTCQHVWNYAQAAARIFPGLERDTRERVDYGIAYLEDGALGYRAETAMHIAHDGQAGTILRTWREHTTSTNYDFLTRLWPRVKRSIQRLIADDKDRDGILEGWQYNTLDAGWYGEIAWISSLYLAALQAGRAMAEEMLDEDFANELGMLIRRGQRNLTERLFNGEYFIQKRDPAHPEAPGHGIGCHIDQVFGESFLHQVGLEPVLDREKVRTALRSLWKYNFVPDAGAYRKKIASIIPGGRWYAMDGEAGLLMTTFPKGEAELAAGKGNPNWMVGYFNECMNGFEYQVAAHMIAEGMISEGLAIVKALDERYDASKRNPFNEIECSDHYARSMAAYGAFLTACGFAFHGPKGIIRFAPKISPDNFRAPFTAGEAWGTYEQKMTGSRFDAKLHVKWGRLRLQQIEVAATHTTSVIPVKVGKATIEAKVVAGEDHVMLVLPGEVVLREGEALSFRL